MAVGSPAFVGAARAARAASGGRVVCLRLLGPLAIESREPLERMRAATEELVVLLALRRHGAGRDEMVETLWPGCDPLLGRQRFWQSASEARQVLGPALIRVRDRYRLDRTCAWVDVDELDRLMAEARGAEGERVTRLSEQAFELFRAEPLAGCDYHWAEGERRRLQANLVELAEQVARLRLGREDLSGALATCERGLAVDELNERLARMAMDCEGKLGLRSAVARRYETLVRRLEEGFGLEPERQTRALFRALLGQA